MAALTLDGSGSRATDGSIVSYQWFVDGDEVGQGVNPVVSGLAIGVYSIELLVTHSGGATATDSVLITVSTRPR